MSDQDKQRLGKLLWDIADKLRGSMDADDFRDYMLAFLFLRYLSDNYTEAARKELGREYPNLPDSDRRIPLAVFYKSLKKAEQKEFEELMRRRVHYVLRPEHLWDNIAELARTQSDDLLNTLLEGFKYIENESFQQTFHGLFSEINLLSDKLGRSYNDRNKRLWGIVGKISEGLQ
jgi:type I restriction enzyme M protein